MDAEIVIPKAISRTGVGIAWTRLPNKSTLSFVLICPDCDERLIYQSTSGSSMICMECRKTFDSFPGIPTEKLGWGGLYNQHFSYTLGEDHLDLLVRWIERWTGLSGLSIDIY